MAGLAASANAAKPRRSPIFTEEMFAMINIVHNVGQQKLLYIFGKQFLSWPLGIAMY